MRVIRFETREEFTRRVTPFLMTHEAENCFFLGHVADRDLKPEILKIALEDDAGEVVGVAMKWPGRHMVLTDAPEAAVDLLVDHLIDAGIVLEGAQSHSHVAQRFVDRYTARTGAKPGTAPGSRTEMALHVLSKVNHMPPVPGTMRLAEISEVDLMADWVAAFCRDCNLPRPKDGERGREMERIGRKEKFVWDVDGQPVSTACIQGPTPNGIRISVVYTPPEFRGRGYASACVAVLSQHMLDSGKRFCFLYTDLANPTSNKIYKAIGYEPVCDNLQILFEGATGGH
jgi:predicted GNAT family acetyltransferase